MRQYEPSESSPSTFRTSSLALPLFALATLAANPQAQLPNLTEDQAVVSGTDYPFSSLAADGDIAVAGSFQNYQANVDSGTVLVFRRVTNPTYDPSDPSSLPEIWVQDQELFHPIDPGFQHHFGRDVAVSGNTILVSSALDPAAQVFTFDPSFVPGNDPSDPNDGGRGPGTTGAWVRTSAIAVQQTSFGSELAQHVAISGDVTQQQTTPGVHYPTPVFAVIGDAGRCCTNYPPGNAQVFRYYRDGSWEHEVTLAPSLEGGASFGAAVSAVKAGSWDYVLVGAPLEDVNGVVNAGTARMYRGSWLAATGWVEEETVFSRPDPNGNVVSPDGNVFSPRANDQFGSSVSLSVDGQGRPIALIGAGGVDTFGIESSEFGNEGEAYVYVRNDTTGTWELEATLSAWDGLNGWCFGGYFDGNFPASVHRAVDLEGDHLVVGAWGAAPPFPGQVGSLRGSAYVFHRENGTWSPCARLYGSDIGNGSGFGHAVALAGDWFFGGTQYNSTKLYTFDDPCSKVPPPPAPRSLCQKPTDALHWWTGDGDGSDIGSGNSPVTLMNGAGFFDGKVQGAFALDGLDDHARTTSAAVPLGAAPRTIELWFRSDKDLTAFPESGLVVYGSPAFGKSCGLITTTSAPGKLYFLGYGPDLAGTTTLVPETWYHAAVTYDGTTVRLYLNGVEEASRTATLDTVLSPYGVTIGSWPERFSYWDGLIDEVTVWDRALTGAEVLALYEDCPMTDDAPPIVTIVEPAEGDVFGTSNITMDVTVEDASGTWVTFPDPAAPVERIDTGGVHSISGPATLPLEGDNELTVNAVDDFGNMGGTSVTVVRDTIRPQVSILSPAEGAVLSDGTVVSYSVLVDDATETTLYPWGIKVAPGSGPLLLPYGVNAVMSGSFTLNAWAVDAAGNISDLAARTVILDLDAPAVTIDVPANGAIFDASGSAVGVTATISDLTGTTVFASPGSGSVVVLPAGGGTFTDVASLVEGFNTITVTATDEGSTSGSDEVMVLLDTTPPLVTIVSPSNLETVRGTIDFDATASDPAPGSGVDEVTFMASNVVSIVLAPPFETTLDTTTLSAGDGWYSFDVLARDRAMNDATDSVLVYVDNTPPVVTIDAPAAGAVVGGSIQFDATISDSGSGAVSFDMLVAGQDPYPTDGSTTYSPSVTVGSSTSFVDTTLFPDGPLNLAVAGADDAGNSASAEITVIVDNQAPSACTIDPPDGSVVSGVVTIVAVSDDPNLAFMSVVVGGEFVGTSSTSPLVVAYDTTTRLDGPVTILVSASDVVGNSSQCSSTIVVDNVPAADASLHPGVLNLKAKGKGSLNLEIEGASLGLLLPTEVHAWELRVAGGSPVRSTQGFAGDDALADQDADGIPDLTVKFDRQLLIGSIEAGIASGALQRNSTITVEVFADGRKIAEDTVKILH